MKLILESIPLSRNEDIDRFLSFYDEMIKEKRLTEFKKYSLTRKKVKKLKNEEDEWEDDQKDEEFANLTKQIVMKNKGNFESYFEGLESKYGKKKGRKNHEIEEEKFEEIRNKFEKNKKDKSKKAKK